MLKHKSSNSARRAGGQNRRKSSRFSLDPNRGIAAWKAYPIITFFAGLLAATTWFVSYRMDQEMLVINTHSLSSAKSDEEAVSVGVPKPTDRILVKFKRDVSATKKKAVAEKYELSEKNEIKQIGIKILQVPNSKAAEAIAKRLMQEDSETVEFAEVDMLVPPALVPNDPLFSSQWHHPKVQTPQAWDATQGNGVTVAILDTGVNVHSDLTRSSVPPRNFYTGTNDVTDVYGHGTAVAGTAAAVGNNGIGVSGVGPNTLILPIKIAADDGYGSWSAMAQGIVYAADNGARVVNISYAVCDVSSVVSAASYLRSKGGVLVASAGNTGTNTGYIPKSETTCVSATGSGDGRASWSSYGAYVDVAAPGMSIYTTAANGGYRSANGTSFSSPLTAGIYALMFSANPGLTPAQADSILFSTAKDLGTTGRDDYYGYGRVDAAAAVAATLNIETDTLPPTAPTNLSASLASSIVTLGWTASSDNVGVAQYIVYRDGNQIGTTTKLSYSDTTVSPGTTYVYTVKAGDASNNLSAASDAVTVTVPVPTLALTSVTAKVTSATTATVSWTTNMPASGSLLEYGTSATNLGGSQSSNQITTSYSANLIGLMRKTRYYYRVTVTGMDGEKIVSSIQSFTTRPK